MSTSPETDSNPSLVSHEKPKVLELKEVGFSYPLRGGFFQSKKFWALQKISFTLHKGESLGIIGKNGAGKSTLLRLLAGIVKPDRGELINYGYSTTLLTLQAGFTPYLTGRENAIMNGLIMGFKKKEIVGKLESIKEYSNLGDYFDQPISSYSSGMKARLGFSIAFQIDPEVLLLDEVMGVGDEAFRKKSSQEMKRKIRSDKTIVLVSHSPPTIKHLCDRAVLISEGKTVLEGNPKEVLALYKEISAKNR